ncbi:MAG TPA: HAD family hydrolase [Polyangia bacterium]|jgi:putative hydrolase of the HAD superfamily|nr:HAD family hydrolase [Polyangia bacterium]
MSASYQEAAALFKPIPRAILFDAGFTLTFHDGARIAAYAAQAGVTADAAALERAERALRAELRETEGVVMRTHADGGFSWHERLYRRLLALAETPGDDASLDRAAAVILRAHRASNAWRRIGAGVRQALERLRAAGFQLAVVSNSEGTIEQMLVEIELRDLFATVVDSSVVGFTKPDPRIFAIALERLGVAPGDALMVGDSPSADVDGARAVGIRAALIDPYDFYPWSRAPRFSDVAALTEALLGSLD